MEAITAGTLTGKARGQKIRTGIEKSLENMNQMQLAPETTAAYEQAMAGSKQGMDPYTRQLMLQQLGMGQQSLMGLYKLDPKAALSRAVSADRAMKSGILQFGQSEAEARARKAGIAIQAGLSVGQQRMGLERYKTEGLYNYLTGRLRQRQETLSNVISGVAQVGGQIAAAALSGGATIPSSLLNSAAAGAASGTANAATNWGLKGLGGKISPYNF